MIPHFLRDFFWCNAFDRRRTKWKKEKSVSGSYCLFFFVLLLWPTADISRRAGQQKKRQTSFILFRSCPSPGETNLHQEAFRYFLPFFSSFFFYCQPRVFPEEQDRRKRGKALLFSFALILLFAKPSPALRNPKESKKFTSFVGKLNVCTYICDVKLEQAIQSNKFKNEVHKAGLNILYTAWWLKTVMSKELKEFGLTHEQYNVLRILKGKHPEQMCVRDIACRMIEKSSNVPRIIDRLELKKLVKRATSSIDKRETVINLTQSGLTLLEATNASVNKVMDGALTITNHDAAILNQLLEKVRATE